MPRLTSTLLALMALLAGCAGAGLSHSDTVSISEDQFYNWGFETSGGATLEFSLNVNSGPNVEFWVMTEPNFQNFQAGNQFVHASECARSPVNSVQGTCTLDAGRWFAVIDNSDSGNVQPPVNFVDDPAVVAFTFSVS